MWGCTDIITRTWSIHYTVLSEIVSSDRAHFYFLPSLIPSAGAGRCGGECVGDAILPTRLVVGIYTILTLSTTTERAWNLDLRLP